MPPVPRYDVIIVLVLVLSLPRRSPLADEDGSSSSIRFSACFKIPFFDYENEHEDDDEYE
jgi:hypothetical protein